MPITLSFGGAGKHFPVMMGVAHGLKTHFNLDWQQVHVHSISSGSTGALCLLLSTPDEIDRLVRVGIEAAHNKHCGRREDYYINIIRSMLPENAYKLLGERLTIGKSILPFLKAKFHTGGFESQEQLIDQLYKSCSIPFITSGFHQELDGGFSHQYAVSDANTVVVTLKTKLKSDLSLREISFFLELLLASPEKMLEMYQEGKDLVRDNLAALGVKLAKGAADDGMVLFAAGGS